MSFDAFQDKLALDLMNNTFAGAPPKVSDSSPNKRPRTNGGDDRAVGMDKHDSPLLHDFRTVRSVMTESKGQNKTKTCTICHNRSATVFCLPCSITAGDYPKKLVALCAPGAGVGGCIGKHMQNHGH
jgi:hypothetical protein